MAASNFQCPFTLSGFFGLTNHHQSIPTNPPHNNYTMATARCIAIAALNLLILNHSEGLVVAESREYLQTGNSFLRAGSET